MFVTNWILTTKIQKISEITNFFRHYFLSRTEVLTYNYYLCIVMLGKASVIKTRNQVKDIPVHQERVFLLRQPIHKTKDIITGQ